MSSTSPPSQNMSNILVQCKDPKHAFRRLDKQETSFFLTSFNLGFSQGVVCCQRRGEYNPRHWVLQFVVHDGCWVTTFSKIFQFFIVGHVHNSFLMALHNLLEPLLVVYDGGFFPVSAVSFLFEIELHTSFTFSSFLIVPIDCKW